MTLRAAKASGARANRGLNQCRNTKLVVLACQLAIGESSRPTIRPIEIPCEDPAMTLDYRILRAGDAALLDRVADDVFDGPVQPALAREFLGDDRHHLAVAIDDGLVVGFASGVHYVHPDKPAELWINEVAVAPTHLRRGLAQALLRLLFDAGRALGCTQAWVLTDSDNTAAMRLYASVGGDPGSREHVMFEFNLRPESAKPDPRKGRQHRKWLSLTHEEARQVPWVRLQPDCSRTPNVRLRNWPRHGGAAAGSRNQGAWLSLMNSSVPESNVCVPSSMVRMKSARPSALAASAPAGSSAR